MKVLTSEDQEAGIKYAVWSELILIYLLVPGSSFMGHLAGILAGLTFSKTRIGKFLRAMIEKCTGNCFNCETIEHKVKERLAFFPGDRIDGAQNAYQNQGDSTSYNSSQQSSQGFFGGRFGFQQRPTYGFRNPNSARQPPNNGPSYGWNIN